ncbi:hypothetical protein MNEG_10129, partial [Monoraphidium neglectum]
MSAAGAAAMDLLRRPLAPPLARPLVELHSSLQALFQLVEIQGAPAAERALLAAARNALRSTLAALDALGRRRLSSQDFACLQLLVFAPFLGRLMAYEAPDALRQQFTGLQLAALALLEAALDLHALSRGSGAGGGGAAGGSGANSRSSPEAAAHHQDEDDKHELLRRGAMDVVLRLQRYSLPDDAAWASWLQARAAGAVGGAPAAPLPQPPRLLSQAESPADGVARLAEVAAGRVARQPAVHVDAALRLLGTLQAVAPDAFAIARLSPLWAALATGPPAALRTVSHKGKAQWVVEWSDLARSIAPSEAAASAAARDWLVGRILERVLLESDAGQRRLQVDHLMETLGVTLSPGASSGANVAAAAGLQAAACVHQLLSLAVRQEHEGLASCLLACVVELAQGDGRGAAPQLLCAASAPLLAPLPEQLLVAWRQQLPAAWAKMDAAAAGAWIDSLAGALDVGNGGGLQRLPPAQAALVLRLSTVCLERHPHLLPRLGHARSVMGWLVGVRLAAAGAEAGGPDGGSCTSEVHAASCQLAALFAANASSGAAALSALLSIAGAGITNPGVSGGDDAAASQVQVQAEALALLRAAYAAAPAARGAWLDAVQQEGSDAVHASACDALGALAAALSLAPGEAACKDSAAAPLDLLALLALRTDAPSRRAVALAATPGVGARLPEVLLAAATADASLAVPAVHLLIHLLPLPGVAAAAPDAAAAARSLVQEHASVLLQVPVAPSGAAPDLSGLTAGSFHAWLAFLAEVPEAAAKPEGGEAGSRAPSLLHEYLGCLLAGAGTPGVADAAPLGQQLSAVASLLPGSVSAASGGDGALPVSGAQQRVCSRQLSEQLEAGLLGRLEELTALMACGTQPLVSAAASACAALLGAADNGAAL